MGTRTQLTRNFPPIFSQSNVVRVKCTAMLLTVYLKSNEITFEVKRPQKLPALESREKKGRASKSGTFFSSFQNTVECFLGFCFVVKTSADDVIWQIFDICSHEFSLFFKPIEFLGLYKVNWVEKRLKSCEKMSKVCEITLSKTSTDNVILQIFDIFSPDFSLFSTHLTFYRLKNSIGSKKD